MEWNEMKNDKTKLTATRTEYNNNSNHDNVGNDKNNRIELFDSEILLLKAHAKTLSLTHCYRVCAFPFPLSFLVSLLSNLFDFVICWSFHSLNPIAK